MTVKISLIGAGSGAFSLSLIRDICLTENLRGSTVSFMDINPQRLEAAFTLCQRYARELNFDLKIEKIKIADLKKDILSMQKKYDAQFNHIFDAIDRLISPPEPDPSKKIGFR